MRVQDESGEAAAEDAQIMAVDELRRPAASEPVDLVAALRGSVEAMSARRAALTRRPAARQTSAEIAEIVAGLEPGERVVVTEDAPDWPVHQIAGTLVAWPDGTLVLDVWPWPVRLPSGLPGLAVAGIEVLS